ncbi:MAG: glycerate kinase [Desulfuromonadales bacterium]|nr:glycerate kinase [Desulfuromonadales bacterium]
MKIIIAPDSFKESLSSHEVAAAIEAGFKEVFPDADCIKLPMADGGEGTVEALVAATAGHTVDVEVCGPLGEKVKAFYGVCGDQQTAVIEMAAASGLALVPPEKRNPLLTTSYGTGELIRAALDAGYRQFVVGIGGSATNDAGVGMLQALGVRFLGQDGGEIGPGGAALEQLERIDMGALDQRLRDVDIEVACDVNNPLTGRSGAAAVFGPQKGATPDMVEALDRCLGRFAEIVRRDLGINIEGQPGAGAAGGMGAALMGFLSAKLRSGVKIVIAHVGLEEQVRDADLVITGEGRIDGQSVFGKAPVGIAEVAQRFGVPVVALAGSLGPGAEAVKARGITALFSVVPGPCSLEQALMNAGDNIRQTAAHVAAVIKMSRKD